MSSRLRLRRTREPRCQPGSDRDVAVPGMKRRDQRQQRRQVVMGPFNVHVTQHAGVALPTTRCGARGPGLWRSRGSLRRSGSSYESRRASARVPSVLALSAITIRHDSGKLLARNPCSRRSEPSSVPSLVVDGDYDLDVCSAHGGDAACRRGCRRASHRLGLIRSAVALGVSAGCGDRAERGDRESD